MGKLGWGCAFMFAAVVALGQGGFGGGAQGGFGGAQGGSGFGGGAQSGGSGQGQEQDANTTPRDVGAYLSHRETASILTPGEYVEWELDLKKGKVVIAEARSEAFDPAMEIVEAGKTIASNDDRFPGDQRPLLLWSCPKDGKYLLRVRSFRDRAGGQVFSRHVVLDCLDLTFGENQVKLPEAEGFLFRASLIQGDFVQARVKSHSGVWVSMRSTRINPIGLPYKDLVPGIANIISDAVCAPVDGDYYMWVQKSYLQSFSYTPLTVSLDRLPVEPITSLPTESRQKTNMTGIWSLSLKRGDFVELDSRGGRFSPGVYVALAPDFTKFDPKEHPFAPRQTPDDPGFSEVALRGTGRAAVGILARADVDLWIAAYGGEQNPQKLFVRRAHVPLAGTDAVGKMGLNQIQWWSFDASPGDVVKLTFSVKGFASKIKVLAPDMRNIAERATFAEVDKAEAVFVAEHAGRHLISVSCEGFGGTGNYEIQRVVIPPETLSQRATVSGELKPGEVRVLKFTFGPGPVKLLKVTGNVSCQIASPSGRGIGLDGFSIGNSRYFHGVFSAPTSYLLVLQGGVSSYAVSFVDPP